MCVRNVFAALPAAVPLCGFMPTILLCFLVNQRIIIADVVGTAVFVHTGGYIGLFCFGFGALSACHALAIMYIAYILYILFDDDFGACMVGCW